MIRAIGIAWLLVFVGVPWAAGQDSVEDLLQQATQFSTRGQWDDAIARLSEAIQKEPKNPLPWYLLGREHFRAGRIKESVADFDRYIELQPDAAKRQWERGIALYYAGEFKKGAQQFKDYQDFHDQDVENSAWRYLCVAKESGIEAAKKDLLPIRNDARPPMMAIYALYRGEKQPADVLAAAGKDNQALFYAHLYIGLWHEVAGRPQEAKEHILQARDHKIAHYMWDVARVHAERLEKAPSAQ